MSNKLSYANRRSYWWFRLIKILYIGIFLFTIGCMITSIQFPKVDLGRSTYTVQCLGNNFTFGDFPSDKVVPNPNKDDGKFIFVSELLDGSKPFSAEANPLDVATKLICKQQSVPVDMDTMYHDIKTGKYDDIYKESKNYNLVILNKVMDDSIKWNDTYMSLLILYVVYYVMGVIVPSLFTYIIFDEKTTVERFVKGAVFKDLL